MNDAFLQWHSLCTEIIVSTDEQHTVTGSNTEQRDETDNGRNTDFACSYHQGEDSTNQGQRQVEQDNPTLSRISELGINQQEDDYDTHQRSQQQCTASGFFALELTTEFHVIAFRQLHFGIDALADIIHHPTKVTTTGIGRDDNLTLHILTAHAIRTHRRNYIGYITQWDAFTTWSINHQVVYLVGFITDIILGTDDEVKYLTLFINLRYHGTRQVHFHEFGKLRHGHTILRHHVTFRNDLQLRAFHLLFHIQVGYTFHIADSRLDAVGIHEHVVQIISKEFDGNARLGTRKHGVDTVANRLTQFDIGS